MDEPEGLRVALCNSQALVNGGDAIPFDVFYAGQTCRAFAIRFEGKPYAYLNRCTHVAMEATGVYWKPVWRGVPAGYRSVCRRALSWPPDQSGRE